MGVAAGATSGPACAGYITGAGRRLRRPGHYIKNSPVCLLAGNLARVSAVHATMRYGAAAAVPDRGADGRDGRTDARAGRAGHRSGVDAGVRRVARIFGSF